MKYTDILFDLDGTILDFEAAQSKAFAACLKQNNIEQTDDMLDRYSSINEKLWLELEKGNITKDEVLVKRFEQLFELYGIDVSAEKVRDDYEEALSFDTTEIDNARFILDFLKLRGVNMHIITNGVSKIAKSRIEKSGLSGHFNFIAVSEEAGCAKPCTDFFDYVFKGAGISDKSKVLVVGDSISADIKGAENYELDSVYFNRYDLEIPEDATPTYTINNLYDILKIVFNSHEQPKELYNYYLNCDYNCAEAVLQALCDEQNIAVSKETIKALSCFGGGLAMGETCGAVAAVAAMIGMKFTGVTAHQSPEMKKHLQTAMKEFNDVFGGINCRDIRPKYMSGSSRCLATCELSREIYYKALNTNN